MQFTSTIVAAIMASVAVAQIQLENVASFETYANADCAPPANQVQNINSNTCTFLPQLSARIYYLEKTRANCRLEFYTAGDCSGTPTDTITTVPSGCIDVSTKFSYKAICS
ncbi:hypothetical protein GT037_005901 [Alternaria burnsii]|uniref:Uncharacterized protein n=3 Tax=Alternaria sect. Alternaria TaxID=2499237 RepID=A0A8H7B770_9PLEO|nr:hypothetical protein AA0111_g3537 [Alternaria arborescens]XP_038786637.1 uncharacterized protein GT037_005901 [Alternaria burnsii]KAB2103149.1 hypothetical protein AG0111_0g8159 [Alternaria gaisen]KAH6841639.1 hypothetical protein B0T12DRAFT_263915 [Alternaria alternata]KAF7676396.1 hypothetical protein GT037_005901 [Alternaria burnsii]RYN34813.1 hypothetical protein AA0112_g5238 [Alternaria arborescens]RYO34847.1 hypothetical protein AA0111_g3537 [Alternaria arborescens]